MIALEATSDTLLVQPALLVSWGCKVPVIGRTEEKLGLLALVRRSL